MKSLTQYFKGIQTELTHVVWPSQRHVIWFTVIIIIASFAVGYYLGLFDVLFARALDLVI